MPQKIFQVTLKIRNDYHENIIITVRGGDRMDIQKDGSLIVTSPRGELIALFAPDEWVFCSMSMKVKDDAD